MASIRVSAKAVIIKEGKILLLKHEDEQGDWYSLPGGGQNHGEKLSEALIRECREEIGTTVKVEEVLFIRDYIADNHEFKDEDPGAHQLEIMFECVLPEQYFPRNGTNPDSTQKGVLWVKLAELSNIRLFPKELIVHLQNNGDNFNRSKIYLGDVN
ncbi:MAG TPA: NUDIX domain-containing protein [Pyrinomonadaceae bacterium]|jgi:ADP-ribose pyrophosphatase YjhB (NUDIX family)